MNKFLISNESQQRWNYLKHSFLVPTPTVFTKWAINVYPCMRCMLQSILIAVHHHGIIQGPLENTIFRNSFNRQNYWSFTKIIPQCYCNLCCQFSKEEYNISYIFGLKSKNSKGIIVKFIYSEKAKNFCEISTLLLSYVVVVPVKSKVEISQNFVAFSGLYMNFILWVDIVASRQKLDTILEN